MDIENNASTLFDPSAIVRPARSLLAYYFVVALAANVAFPVVFFPLMVKYLTLRYRIDEEGVQMSWGFLFRREVLLTHRRIQDIHVRRNIVHRWLKLAAVAIQTASGTAGAEMTIEGVHEFEPLRDWLYSKMRGARGDEPAQDTSEQTDVTALALLREIRDEARRLAGEEETRAESSAPGI